MAVLFWPEADAALSPAPNCPEAVHWPEAVSRPRPMGSRQPSCISFAHGANSDRSVCFISAPLAAIFCKNPFELAHLSFGLVRIAVQSERDVGVDVV